MGKWALLILIHLFSYRVVGHTDQNIHSVSLTSLVYYRDKSPVGIDRVGRLIRPQSCFSRARSFVRSFVAGASEKAPPTRSCT